MSLTAQDLHAIRAIVEEEARNVVQGETRHIVNEELRLEVAPISVKMTSLNGKVDALVGKTEALEDDVKDIYKILTKINRNLKFTAREVGVTLPS